MKNCPFCNSLLMQSDYNHQALIKKKIKTVTLPRLSCQNSSCRMFTYIKSSKFFPKDFQIRCKIGDINISYWNLHFHKPHEALLLLYSYKQNKKLLDLRMEGVTRTKRNVLKVYEEILKYIKLGAFA
jgi:hypothetical protein